MESNRPPIQAPSQNHPPSNAQPAKTLVAKIATCLGIAAIPSASFCLPAIPMSILAITFGHIAGSQIKSSRGALKGIALARIGYGLGYLSIPIFLVSSLIGFLRIVGDTSEKELSGLDLAERSIVTRSGGGHAYGNSEAALALAQKFNELMDELSDEAFSESKSKIKLNDGKYIAWCELREDKCAFIVHVPEYRKFTSDAKKALNQTSWAVAEAAASLELEEGDELAVGLKGIYLYGSIQTGVITDGEILEAGVRVTDDGDRKSLLFRFFEPEEETDPHDSLDAVDVHASSENAVDEASVP